MFSTSRSANPTLINRFLIGRSRNWMGFLSFEATPADCIDIGGKDAPRFDSSAHAQRVMRRSNAIGDIFDGPPEFAPIL
jgi:hypothetical protein